MSLTVTWDMTGSATEVWQVEDDVLASLEQYRLTLVERRQLVDGGPIVQVLTYATIKDMIVGTFIINLVRPAMSAFPTQVVAELIEARAAADLALHNAMAAAEQGALIPQT